MVDEVASGAPGAGAGNEGLQERTLSLHGVVEVMAAHSRWMQFIVCL
jgi:hypothetical protein